MFQNFHNTCFQPSRLKVSIEKLFQHLQWAFNNQKWVLQKIYNIPLSMIVKKWVLNFVSQPLLFTITSTRPEFLRSVLSTFELKKTPTVCWVRQALNLLVEQAYLSSTLCIYNQLNIFIFIWLLLTCIDWWYQKILYKRNILLA